MPAWLIDANKDNSAHFIKHILYYDELYKHVNEPLWCSVYIISY